MAQSFLATGQHRLLVLRLHVNDTVRRQTGLGEGRGEQILPDQAPQHRPLAARGNPGGEQGGSSAVNRAIAAASHFMQRPQREAAARQTRVNRRQTERQRRRHRAVTGFNSPDFFAQNGNGGTWPHGDGILKLRLLCSLFVLLRTERVKHRISQPQPPNWQPG